ncbi:MAG: leucine-rich repeat protein [Clostridia bacterium]|nr:leucine-rich repeat protein [Clostridia bacterium]
MKTFKRIVFVLAAAALLIGCVPLGFAEEETSGNWKYETIEGGIGIRITGYTGSEKVVKIPDTLDGKIVTEIGPSAFSGTQITEITIPKNVNNMNDSVSGDGTSALDGMNSLNKVIFEDGFERKSIPVGAVRGNTAVTEVDIPASVEEIGVRAFEGCTHLNKVPMSKNTEYIYECAFNGCAKLDKIYIPDGVLEIGAMAFANTILTSVTLPDSLTSIGHSAFLGTPITEITIPKNVNNMNSDWEGNGTSALYGMNSLNKVIFEDGFERKSIPAYAAKDNTAVTEVIIPDSVEEIGTCAFEGCIHLKKVTMSKNTEYVDECAFNGCAKLDKIDIPDGVLEIGTMAFANTKLTSVTLPDSLTSIGHSAFSGTPITEITIPKNVNNMISVWNGNYTSALYGMNSLNRVIFTSGFERKSIPDYAVKDNTAVTEVVIPAGVEAVGDHAFEGCTHLKKAVFPSDAPYADAVAGTIKEQTGNNDIKVIKSDAEYNKYTKDADPVRPGDVTGDGQVLADDARLALRKSAKLEELDEKQFRAADVDGNGQVLADDARQILRYSAKLQSAFDKAK